MGRKENVDPKDDFGDKSISQERTWKESQGKRLHVHRATD